MKLVKHFFLSLIFLFPLKVFSVEDTTKNNSEKIEKPSSLSKFQNELGYKYRKINLNLKQKNVTTNVYYPSQTIYMGLSKYFCMFDPLLFGLGLDFQVSQIKSGILYTERLGIRTSGSLAYHLKAYNLILETLLGLELGVGIWNSWDQDVRVGWFFTEDMRVNLGFTHKNYFVRDKGNRLKLTSSGFSVSFIYSL